MLTLTAAFKVFINILKKSIWFTTVRLFRRAWYFVNRRSPILVKLQISDPVLLHDRVIRIKYETLNVAMVEVKGIDKSIQLSGSFIFTLPESQNQIEIIFHGGRERIHKRQSFVFIPVKVSEHVQDTLKISVPIPIFKNHSSQILPRVAATIRLSKNTLISIQPDTTIIEQLNTLKRANLITTYPEIDKTNRK